MEIKLPVNSDSEGLDLLLKKCESSVRCHALRALGLWAKSESSLIELRPKAKTLLGQLGAPSFGIWIYLLIDIREASKKASKTSLKTANQFTSMEWEIIWSAWRHDVTPETIAKLKLALNGLNLEGVENFENYNICALSDIARKIRNYYRHYHCSDEWIQQATGAMEVIHAELTPLLEVKKDMPGVVEPWFFSAEDGEIFSYMHCTETGTPVYCGQNGDVKPCRDKEAFFFSAYEQLIGKPLSKEDIQEQLMHRADQSPGIILGEFLLIKKVGEGGFAIVYEGVQLGICRKVAVKVLRDGNSPEVISRFQREAEHLSRYEGNASIVDVITCQKDPWLCPHGVKPQDIPIIEEFESGTRVRHYMALEWIDGETLDQVFAHPPKTSRIVEMFLSVTDALIAIHTDNLVHRDIKPANIMVDKEGKVKLMDFGIALENDPGRSIVTKVGTALGTPAYMSPEQINAQLAKWQVGPASDIYSLGITFFELFTGTRCMNHDKRTTGEIRDLKRTMTRIDIPSCGLDWSLRAILAGCLEPEIADRYKSAQKLRDDIVRYLNNESILYREPPFSKRLRLAYKRNTFAFRVGIAAVSLIAMLTAYHIFTLNQTLTKVEREKAEKEKALIKVEKEKANTEEALKRVKKYSLRALSAQGKISQVVPNVDLTMQYVLVLALADLFQPGDEDYLLSDTEPISAIGCTDAVLNRCFYLYQSGKFKELDDWCDRCEIIFAKAYKIAGEPICKEIEHMRVRLIWNRAAGRAMEEKYPEALHFLDESDKIYSGLQTLSEADIKAITKLMIDGNIYPQGTSLDAAAIENQRTYRKLQRLLTKKQNDNMRLMIAEATGDKENAIKVFKEIIPLYESILEITPEDIMTRYQMLSQYFLVGSMANDIESVKIMARYKELKSEYLVKGLLSKEYVEMLNEMEKGLKE